MCTVGLFQLDSGHILNLLSFLGVPSTLSNDCMIIRGMVSIKNDERIRNLFKSNVRMSLSGWRRLVGQQMHLLPLHVGRVT